MPAPALRQWILTNRYLLASVVTLAALAIPFFAATKKSEWKVVYVAAAERLLEGRDFFTVETGYTYPPLQALMAVPCVLLPAPLSSILWYAVNAGALIWLLRAAWRLTGGGRLDGHPPAGWREEAVFVLGLIVGGSFCFHAVAHKQTDLVVGALVVGGCEFLSRGRGKTAGILIGLAAAMKCTPLLFAPYLLLKRQFAASACLVAVALGANLLPDLASRPPDGGTWLGRWYTFFLAPMARPDYTPGIWASDVIYNQSLAGAAGRWTRTTWEVVGSKVRTREVPSTIDPNTTKRIVLIVGMGMCGVAVLAAARRRETEFKPPESPPKIALECGTVLVLMLLLSPMSSIPHSVTMLVPGFAMARLAVVGRSRTAAVIFAFMILTALSSNKDMLGGKLYTLGLWYGGVTTLAVLAYAGSVTSMLSRPRHLGSLAALLQFRSDERRAA